MKRRKFLKNIILGSMAVGTYIASYNVGEVGFLEAIKATSDPFKAEINKGAKKLDDSHAHFYIPKDELEMQVLIDTILKKVDRQAITAEDKRKSLLNYKNLINIIGNYNKNGRYEIENKGLVSVIKKGDLNTEIYQSQEIRTLQRFHIIAEGCENNIQNYLDARDVIDKIHKQKGIAIIAHPFMVEREPFWFWYPDSKQRKFLEEELIPRSDSVEVFNAMSLAYITLSNSKIKYLLKEHNITIKGIAVTDTHPVGIGKSLHQIGRAGILYNDFNTDGLSDREIFELKRLRLKSGAYDLLENYIDPATFFKVIGLK